LLLLSGGYPVLQLALLAPQSALAVPIHLSVVNGHLKGSLEARRLLCTRPESNG
jgi:hypothetical protein